MEVLVERCAGIDVGRADVKVCVRLPGARAGSRRQEIRTFATTTNQLLRLRDWLLDERVSRVAMESTGVYWRPVFYLLEDAVECWLVNAATIKKMPGRKSDVSDAAWIAQLLECGLLRPSFVPPPPIRALRDLTRYRTKLVRERSREVQRLHDVLEDAGIKLGCFISDITGVSGREMIEALIGGQRDPQTLAELARSRMRPKIPDLVEALTGRFSDHHARLARMMLARIDRLDADIAELSEAVTDAMRPFRHAADRLTTIPGVGPRAAELIIAETGADMTRFPSRQALSSWAGMCPGSNESAGRHLAGTTRQGDPWLRGCLGECATAASRTKGTYLAERYRRLARRRGPKRAKVAIGRNILEAAWTVLSYDVDYADLGPEHYLQRVANPARRAHRLIQELRALGYNYPLPQPG